MHLQKVFEHLGYKAGEFPNSEYLANHGVAIPMFPELTKEEIVYIINTLNNYHE